MSTLTPSVPRENALGAWSAGLASWAFAVVFLYCWISINPFEDLANPPSGVAAINQLVGFALTAGLCIYAAGRGLLPFIARPRLLIGALFFWLAVTALMAPDMGASLRRLMVSGLICLCASALLVVPKSREQFRSVLAFCAFAVLGLSFLGVLFISARAVHQAYDLVEPGLAGDWRGVFSHKNIAAQAAVILVFVGLYLLAAGARVKGFAVTLLAAVFLWMTNGKTALGILPVVLVMAFLLDRRPVLGAVAFWIVLLGISVLTLGSALSPAIFGFIESLGMDATFTARTDIWALALRAAAERPLGGYGFGNFWGSELLANSPYAIETWAVDAAHAHNGFVEMLLHGGVPALVLTMIWLVVLPLRDIRQAGRRQADRPLTVLFTRIWVFGIFSALLESNFFTGTGPVWFSLLLAVFGLRQQARAYLIVEAGDGARA